jgi:DeoD family purine-nucleoside phosphorylase
MPIHLRAEPGAYAEVCLLPGDPLRARYIAETFFDDPVEVNDYRGLLGYTGTFQGKPVSVQASGMGCPSAAIVIEELVQLGVEKILRVGTCGGLVADVMGELIVPISAAAADTTALQYVDNEPYAPTASFEIVHELVHQAKGLGTSLRVGPIVSSAIFYQPDAGQAQRWADRGILAVEMEAAVLFTLGALRKIQTGCVLLVSDLVPGAHPVEAEQFVYISDEEMREAVDGMSELALRAVTAGHDGH